MFLHIDQRLYTMPYMTQAVFSHDFNHPHPLTCYTAAGCLIHEDKVLLVKHKKLGFWLNPGGHIEPHELPHEAAEREFFEETGVTVEAYWTHLDEARTAASGSRRDYFTPNPISTNLHWISEDNFISRLKAQDAGQTDYQRQLNWEKGCEQHLNFLYLVRPLGTIALQHNSQETDGLEWFSREEMANLETKENIRQEVAKAFEIFASITKAS